MTNTLVTRVLETADAASQGLDIRTVEIRSPDSPDSIQVSASKEVILSSGAINTPHILLHSGIGDQGDLETLGIPVLLHNPDVGRNLSDHPFFVTTYNVVPSSIDLGPWAKWVFIFQPLICFLNVVMQPWLQFYITSGGVGSMGEKQDGTVRCPTFQRPCCLDSPSRRFSPFQRVSRFILGSKFATYRISLGREACFVPPS